MAQSWIFKITFVGLKSQYNRVLLRLFSSVSNSDKKLINFDNQTFIEQRGGE